MATINQNSNKGTNQQSPAHFEVETDGSKASALDNLSEKAGELLEKAGHKISEAGAPGVGQRIHDLGDKLEKDHENPNHPHTV